MLALALAGAFLGLAAAVPIGPVNLAIMRRGIDGGFTPACLVGLGAVTIDVLYSIGFTLGFASLSASGLLGPLGFVGAGVLLILGLLSIRDGFRPLSDATPPPAPGCDPATLAEGAACPVPTAENHGPFAGRFGAYLTGFSMTATNPMTLAFWASVGASTSRFDLTTIAARLALSLGVAAGALLWVLAFATILHHTRHRLSPRVRRGLTVAGGVGMVVFGLRLITQSTVW